jgi:hypothetical protein
MQLVMNPWQFDVIVTTNLFGDILSDQLAGLVGGLGMAPGANIGESAAIFEAVHGSAPDIAGKGVANPLALLLAACLMLEHVGYIERADQVRAVTEKVLREDRVRTPDLNGKASTQEFTQAITRRLRAHPGSLDSWWGVCGEPPEHDADHGDADEGDDSCGVAFEIASQTAIASDPGERSFDNPSLGQDLEANGIGSLHNF